MKPINTFLEILDKRTYNEVNKYKNRGNILLTISMIVAFILTILIVVIGLSVTNMISRQLGRDPAEISNIAERIANGDLTVVFEKTNEKDKSVYNSMKKMTNGLINLITEIKYNASGINTGANQVSLSAQTLSQEANDLTSNVEQMSININQIESTIDQNAESTQGSIIATNLLVNFKRW